MPTLITGCAGFVGAHLAKRLVEQGERVIGIVRDWPATSSLDALGVRVTLARADVRDREALDRILRQYEIDTVYHLAAVSTVAEAQRNPVDAFDVNVMGTVKLLDACRTYGKVSRILVVTSDKVYGASPVPYEEGSPLQGGETYPASKVCQDVAARSFAYTFDLPVAVVRAVNIYGPGDLDKSRLIPGNLFRLLDGQPAKLYSHAQGMTRQFVYVDDVVDAYQTVARSLPNAPGRAYNVGGYEQGGVNVGRVLEGLVARTGGRLEVIESRLREIPRQFLSDTELRKLGWAPRICMERGLDDTVIWYQNFVKGTVGVP